MKKEKYGIPEEKIVLQGSGGLQTFSHDAKCRAEGRGEISMEH